MKHGLGHILSFNVNEQLTIMVQKKYKVKERARLYWQRRLVNVTRPDKWSHNNFYTVGIPLLN